MLLKDILSFQFRYFLFWTFFFLIGRSVFILYHIQPYSKVPLNTIIEIFLHGIRLDFSMAGYVCLLPFIFSALTFFINGSVFLKIIRFYTYLFLFLIGFIIVCDAEIFTVWGSRIDHTIFRYIKNINETLASTLSSPILLLVTIWLSFSFFFCYLFHLIFKRFNDLQKGNFFTTALGLICTAVLIIPIRGGFQLAPINESVVYFSKNHLANNGALNVTWGFLHSILENHDDDNPYTFYNSEEARTRVLKMYPQNCTSPNNLISEKPNVLLILWESFTSKTLSTYEGKVITPNFQRYVKEGIYFDNIYASGDRSDKGIVAVLSGYPAQPLHSVINHPYKSKKLPSVFSDLYKQGYSTSFYYGGEPEFANIKSYLYDHDVEKLVSKENFDKKEWNSKWGAHDEYVFSRLFNDLKDEKKPFFSTIFTLSSHEPFEIPISPLLPPVTRENQFLNSHYYADSCLGDFLDRAKNTAWWKNTLIIIVADHGHPMPGGFYAEKGPEEFSIPMLWLGGALKNSGIEINKTGSQTDIAKTLLHQLNLPASQYIFSTDLFCNNEPGFAYYAFNNGFGYINDSSKVLYRNDSKIFKAFRGNLEPSISHGKAYLQFSYQDYLDK